jgi:hypothetical protein
MESEALLARIADIFPGSRFVCRICRADTVDAYCHNCTELATYHIGDSARKPKKWTECDKCGTPRLGVHTSKTCYGHDCGGTFVVAEVQPTWVKKPAKKARPRIVEADTDGTERTQP